MEPVLLVCFPVSFLTTYLLMPVWIRAALKAKLTGKDVNKAHQPEVAEMGGIAVTAGFIGGVLTYIALTTFYFRQSNSQLIYILALLSTVLAVTIVGIIDDVLGWKTGLKQWQKPLLTLLPALPLMAVNAGETSMVLPLLGPVNFGLLYPLLFVPLAVTGAANGFNMLAGLNGLEGGMGVLILGVLGIVSWRTGSGWVALLAFTMVSALLAFLRYNWYPARVFPGNTFTYTVGALIAGIAILGNAERVALLLFSLYFLELLLKARTRFRGECYGRPRGDGTLAPRGDRIESLTHLPMRWGRLGERGIVLLFLSLQALLGVSLLGGVL
jgi:UDP-N-acetylglucosamine--dolichyl-phosphate N-acetylglucosaminephosphotransferase